MLLPFIITFREVLEIALIVSLMMAATKGLPGRNKWISIGFALGIIGSILIAIFIETISNFANGLGQELFNALIALVASILIGSTAVWVSTHGREMVLNMKDKGGRLVSGDLPAKTLSVIIALAVWREGAEIVLFSYGLLLSGLSLTTFLTGAIAGALAGSILGAGLYFGMVQINTKHIFKATSYLLLFIAAGMFALAAKYLVAAGYFGGLSDILWDTSHILSEQSFVGQVLHMFFGYSDSPMIIEVIYYVLFLTLSLLAISLIKRKKL